MGIGAGACFGVVEIAYQGSFNVFWKEVFAYIGYQHFLELVFPFNAMRHYSALILYKHQHMCQFVQQRNQKAILMQSGIDADSVIRCIPRRMSVIAQNTFALAGEGKVYGMILKILNDLLKSIGR